ncbi:MAG: ABC transporter permease [Bacteroidia bacterium]|nr:ABC transporter permease [Bacteroidia bacterium]
MLKLFLDKVFYGLLVTAGVVMIVFFLFTILPGDPARMILGQRADLVSVETINRELGRDLPVSSQFLLYVNDLSPLALLNTRDSSSRIFADASKYGSFIQILDTGSKTLVLKKPYLRRSYQTRDDVTAVLLDALPGTVVLAVAALVFAAFFGILLGTWSALRYQHWDDNLNLIISVLGMSVPSFFAGIIMAWLFGFVWRDWTGLEMTGSLYVVDPFEGMSIQWKNLILPAITLGIRPLSVIVQLTRSSMLEVLGLDYVRTARAKGLSPFAVVVKHALRNALNPVLTAISGWLGSLLAGAVFIEYIFGWKGVGKVTVDALEHYDFPVVMGAVLMVSVFFVIINILVDLLYARLDPRVRA